MIERDKTNKQGKNNPAFMRIAGSDGLEEVFGSKSNGDARSVFEKINGINEKPNSSKEPQNNLIGYTAFYRSWSNKDARGYAMTLPWYTRILWNETNKFDSDSKRIAAKNWLTSKISQDEFAKKTILSSLQKNLVDLPDVAKQLTVDNIVTLLQNPEWLPLNGCSVKLNAVPVYYLLAECANESIWLEIESITCTTSSVGEWKSDSITVDGNLKKTYNDGLFALNTTRTTSSDEIGRRTLFNAGVAVSGKIDSNSQWGKTRSGTNGNSDTSWWEWWDGNNNSDTWSWEWWDGETWSRV